MVQDISPLSALRKRVVAAPTTAGIYKWIGKDGVVLYVGKAKNLRSRLRSYVSPVAKKTAGPWKRSLLEAITDLDITVTNTELEALMLEANLIKQLRPKYNVLMKDDKGHVYVRVGLHEAYPTVEIVRRMDDTGARPTGSSGRAKFFGPYTSMYETRVILDLLNELFPFHACKESLTVLNAGKRTFGAADPPCLGYQIGQCSGLCIGAVAKEEHRRRTDAIVSFFKGDRRPAVFRIQELMESAVQDRKFERAAHLRDALAMVKKIEEKQLVSDPAGDDCDIVGAALMTGRVQVFLFHQRGGKVIGESAIALGGGAEKVAEALEQFLPQYYASASDIPDVILMGEDMPERGLLGALFTETRGRRVRIIVPERGKKSQLLMLAERNAMEKAKQQETKWEADMRATEGALAALKRTLEEGGLEILELTRIECFDISHLGGTETVGSMVVSKNGKAASDHYRSFALRGMRPGENDDYRALEEVLRRRFKYLAPPKEAKPTKIRKLPKKERAAWRALHPAAVDSKGWKEEILECADTEGITLTADMRRKSGERLTYGWLFPAISDRDRVHAALDALEKFVSKMEAYVIVDDALRDTVALHGFFPAAEGFSRLPAVVQGLTGTLFHRKRSLSKPDPSFHARPDLVVIDGGKGQLGVAVRVLAELGIMPPVIGLAKEEEEVFVPGRPVAIPFPKESPAKFLLMRLRDEAHRFANSIRESRGAKRAIGSALDTVPGVGPKTRKELLKKFGSVAGVKEAADAALLEVVTESQLQAIKEHL